MRLRPLVYASCAATFVFAACEKKAAPAPSAAPEEKQQPAAPTAPIAPTPPPVAPKPPKLSAAERSAKLGFVKFLPKDAESVMEFYNGTAALDRLKKSKLWGVINEESGGKLDEVSKPEDGEIGASTYLGKDFFLATGKGTAAQFGNLMTFSRRMNYFQIRVLAASFAKAEKAGKLSGFKPDNKDFEDIFSEILKDPQSGVGLIERSQMPPMWIGFKVGEEQRDKVLQQFVGLLGMLASDPTIAKPVEFERSGSKFSGYKILGEGLAKQMETSRAEMEQKMDANLVTRLITSIKAKNLVIAPGIVGEYVVLFLGSSEEECQIAKSVDESLASNDALSYVDGFATKDIASLVYGASNVVDVLRANADGLAPIVQGIRDGFGDGEASGDLKDVQTLLQIVAERGETLAKLVTTEATGLLAYFDNGLHLEGFGGADHASVLWDKPHKLSQLGAGPDVALFANWTSNPEYNKKASAYVEALVETSYTLANKVASSPGAEEGDLAKFSKGFKLFDSKFREDMLSVWSALSSDFRDGLGDEGAFVLDLKGGVPSIPGLPQKVVDNGKFVRASLIHPVVDRTKLGSSWSKVSDAVARLLKSGGEVAGKEIPMPKPISSDKDTLKTWFFTFPLMSDDFFPSVTLDDKWFVASTSKTQAQELAKQAAAGTDGDTGASFVVHCDAFRSALTQWIKVVDENSADLFKGKESELKKFQDNKGKAQKVIEALSELDSVSVQVRREFGTMRSSIYIKTR